jgi:hypothetical protein
MYKTIASIRFAAMLAGGATYKATPTAKAKKC